MRLSVVVSLFTAHARDGLTLSTVRILGVIFVGRAGEVERITGRVVEAPVFRARICGKRMLGGRGTGGELLQMANMLGVQARLVLWGTFMRVVAVVETVVGVVSDARSFGVGFSLVRDWTDGVFVG